MVMKMENMNIPPNPYKCNVRRPALSISGIEANVITTCIMKLPFNEKRKEEKEKQLKLLETNGKWKMRNETNHNSSDSDGSKFSIFFGQTGTDK